MRPSDSARQKLARADAHLKALHDAFDRFRNSKPYTLVEQIVTEHETPYGIVTVDRANPIPNSFALIAGDACNNLRAVLDHLFSQLLVDHKIILKRPPSFPIFDCLSTFTKSKAANQIKRLPDKWWPIIEGAQPYKRGHDLLSILRELNNADKHHTLMILAQTASFDKVAFPAELFVVENARDEPPKIIVADNQRIEVGTQLIRVPISKWPSERDVVMNASFRFDLVFGDFPPTIANGRNVGGTLEDIRDEVKLTLDTFHE